MTIKFDCGIDDLSKIGLAVTRARKMVIEDGQYFDGTRLTMDLLACHCNGMPLDLDKLLAFDDFNFAHDVFGIERHMDRSTGKLTDCFVPRCARGE